MANLCKAMIPLGHIERIQIYINEDRRKTLAQIKQETGADYLLNGTLYDMETGEVQCHLKADGKIICAPPYQVEGYAWNNGSDFSFKLLPNIPIGQNISDKNFIACSNLITNGKGVAEPCKDPARQGKRGRTAIGIKNGCLALYCSKDASTSARKPKDLRDDLVKDKWESAIMLDGGGSSQCDFCGNKVTSSRRVQHLILVYLKEMGCPYNEPTTNVRNGTRGNNAKWVQWMLNHVMDAGLDVDGIFGPKSVAALLAFQKEAFTSKKEHDGICGKKTREMLIAQFES